jgi:hypothetical protein
MDNVVLLQMGLQANPVRQKEEATITDLFVKKKISGELNE